MYKFSRGVIFTNDRNPVILFSRIICCAPYMHYECFKKIEDLIFVDDKLLMKAAKLTSLKNFVRIQ